MNNNCRFKTLLSGVLLCFALNSCVSDVWEEHYENEGSEVGVSSLFDLMTTNPDLSTFCSMLRLSGYDTVLNTSQSYTVWAPGNEALISIDLNDSAKVIETVQNHIARFTHPTARFGDSNLQKIFVMSGKLLPFEKGSGQYSFGGQVLTSNGDLARNGILYTIGGYVPYAPNMWEALGRTPGLDSVYAYLNPLGSVPYADVANEDSVFSAILPTNTAWIKAYNLIRNYYKCLPGTRDTSAQAQHRLTRSAILQDAFFKADIPDTAAWNSVSFASTGGRIIGNLSNLFVGATKKGVSNGYIWLTDTMRISPTESWHIPIKVEAENTTLGRSNTNSDIYWKPSDNSGFEVSGKRYIVINPKTTSYYSKVAATFPIPNTLSAKYKIYCVFVPSAIEEVASLPCKVNFYLEYINAAGKKTTLTAASKVIVDGTQVSKVLVTEMTFPYCNVFYGNPSDITAKLRVENEARDSETTLFTRTMRIDCVILEPVL